MADSNVFRMLPRSLVTLRKRVQRDLGNQGAIDNVKAVKRGQTEEEQELIRLAQSLDPSNQIKPR